MEKHTPHPLLTQILMFSAVGIGKGYACLHWVAEENSRPAFYIRLSKILEKQHGESGRERGDDEEVSSDSWRKHIERVLGYPIAGMDYKYKIALQLMILRIPS